MINKEDKADVKRVMGGKVASKVAKATNDAKSKALSKAKSSDAIRKYGESKEFKSLLAERDRRDKMLPLHMKMKGGTYGTLNNTH